MKTKRDQRNYIIIGLCMILVVMGVGYAAFSSLLTINGTANISNSWCVGFDSREISAYEITKGVSTGTVPIGSMSFSGDACETNYKPNASLTAHFYQPGDQIEYTLTIVNKSSVTAAIKSILVDGESVTSNTTKTKNNITYIVNMPEDTTLAPNASTTMTVIAKFQNETDVTGNVNGETQTITVAINTEQDDGNGGFTPTPASPYVYAYHTDERTIGTSTVTDGVSHYTSLSSWSNGKTWFLKYELDGNNVIQNAWTCQKFSFIDEPVCLQGGNASYYTANRAKIESLATTFTSNGFSCFAADGYSSCNVDALYVDATSDGYVGAGDYSANGYCHFNKVNGNASCY